jgi:tetratricopeptide (TPR) repeat protein
MAHHPRAPLLNDLYAQYLVDHETDAFVQSLTPRYAVGTLERLAEYGQRMTRRAAVFALGEMGNYSSNAALGKALIDEDRGVRTLAENGIRSLWCRDGNAAQRRRLAALIRLNSSHRYADAVRRGTTLLAVNPRLAEAWNQRAIAYFHCGHFSESIQDCHQALELNPYHFGAAAGMVQCYLQLGDRAAALESFSRALRLNPNLEGVRAHVVYLQRTLKGQD